MPMHHKFLQRLNQKFGDDEIKKTARTAASFAPGRPLDASLVVRKGSVAFKPVQAYLNSMPGSVAESLRGVMHHALTSNPVKPITFAWMPGYDFEVTVSEMGCGITVIVKGRYPADKAAARGKD